MVQSTKGKIILSAILIAAVISAILAINLHSKKEFLYPVELMEVNIDQCFSPNGDGIKDLMNLVARFSGQAGRQVYAFLFVKKGRSIMRLLHGSARFDSSGQAVVTMVWDGKNRRQNIVPDGEYQLDLYYFNFSLLFKSRDKKLDQAFKRVEHYLAKAPMFFWQQ